MWLLMATHEQLPKTSSSPFAGYQCCPYSCWAFSFRQYRRRLVPLDLIVFAKALTVSLTFPDARYRPQVDAYITVWIAYALVSTMAKPGKKLSVALAP
jgi:hypothetical protein